MIKLAFQGSYSGYENSLLPRLLAQEATSPIKITSPKDCDLLILGPFQKKLRHRQLRKLLRPITVCVDSLVGRQYQPLTLFHTGENVRWDAIKADYAISFDLGVTSPTHLRFPLWMEILNWSNEDVRGLSNPRFGKLLDIDRLMRPLGDAFLKKPNRAAFFASHMREPRASLVHALSSRIQVDGFGPHFNKQIKDHNKSGLEKLEILKDFRFNLCPENSLYPGYYTEKIPEAFYADTLPITWVDCNATVDFNPNAFINLLPLAAGGYETAHLEYILSDENIQKKPLEPLLTKKPSLDDLRNFLKNILSLI